ncbi:hypothetical protein C0992_003358 [Termitomyces sp. T32_za158]|nr:hypothetical protein C0992_003358 [Termitomyces sp. T32_za158]
MHRIALRNSARARLAAAAKTAPVVARQYATAKASTYPLSQYPQKNSASEVSSILESRIAGTAVGANVEETGRVLSEPTSPAICSAPQSKF